MHCGLMFLQYWSLFLRMTASISRSFAIATLASLILNVLAGSPPFGCLNFKVVPQLQTYPLPTAVSKSICSPLQYQWIGNIESGSFTGATVTVNQLINSEPVALFYRVYDAFTVSD
jgi:hypothetical protein